MRRVKLTNLGSRITVTSVAICAGTVLVIYLYAVTIGGAASGLGAVKGQILIGGLIAMVIATVIGLYYAQMAARNISRLEDAARKVADGNFETTIPIASAGQLGQLARTFNEMQRRLAELDSARKQFIANASHELRTPIFSLGGFVELLEEEDPSPEERAEFVRTMRQQISPPDQAHRRPARPLPARRGRDGDAGPGSVDLGALAREVTREFGARADLRGSRLELRTPERPRDRPRRPRSRPPDHPYPARQRPHPHSRGHQGHRDHLLRQPPSRADRLRRGVRHPTARPERGSSSASTRPTRPVARGSGWRSPASSPSAWTAASRSAPAAASPPSRSTCRRPR